MKRALSQENLDKFFMQQAINEAKKAYAKDEVPIGAVVVSPDNKIIAKAYNLVETKKSPLAHAEIIAIEKAAKKLDDWRLDGCKLYVTLEPCALCMNLILRSRIKTLIFAAKSKLFGFSLDKYNTFELYKVPMLIREGVCEDEALDLLRSFFKKKRKKREIV